jgi:hypothetical protein
MKKAGVPFTPLRMPPIKSLRTFVPELARLKSVPQVGFGKPELFRDQENRRDAQPALVLKERVMHIPEQACRAGELGAFGSDLGVRMHFGQGEVTKNESQASAEG